MQNSAIRVSWRTVLALVLSAAILLTGTGLLSVSAARRISPEEDFTPGEATLTQLRAFFQNGAYWNHISGTEDTPYSVTDTPCSAYTDSDGLHRDEGVVCNYFEVPGKVWGGWQCCGFTRMMTYLYFGTSCENWDTSTSLSGMKAGDVLYLTANGPHYIWLLSVTDNGDGTKRVTYTDCNGAGRRQHCQIQWDARCTVNMQTQELELGAIGTWDVYKRYVSPGGARTELPDSYKDGTAATTTNVTYSVACSNGQGQTDAAVDMTGDLTLGACAFRRDGYTFAGWTVKRASDGAWLCGTDWKTGVSASSVTRLAAGETLPQSLFTSGGSYTLVATWAENRLTVRYAANGGRCTKSAYTTDETGTILHDGQPVKNTWAYTSTVAATLPDAAEWGLTRTGYTFVGWSLAPTYMNTLTEDDLTARLSSQTGEETYYAVFVPNMTEVWYRTDEGVLNSEDYQLLANGRIARRDHVGWALTRLFYNGTADLMTADELGLTREDQVFVGWTADGKTLVDAAAIRQMAAESFRTRVELTAVWRSARPPKDPSSTKGG